MIILIWFDLMIMLYLDADNDILWYDDNDMFHYDDNDNIYMHDVNDLVIISRQVSLNWYEDMMLSYEISRCMS